jgi:hypothetical protein
MKHTPGPWTVDPLNPESIINYEGEDVAILFVHGKSGEEIKSNVRLIAKAPEREELLEQLLEACREAVDFLEYEVDCRAGSLGCGRLVDKLRAAIDAVEADDG